MKLRVEYLLRETVVIETTNETIKEVAARLKKNETKDVKILAIYDHEKFPVSDDVDLVIKP